MTANRNNGVVLEAVNITKTFTGVTALNNVSLKIYSDEVNAIVGENGGESGDYGPESGRLPSYTGGKWMIDVYVSFVIHFCKIEKNQSPSFFSLTSLINLMTP